MVCFIFRTGPGQGRNPDPDRVNCAADGGVIHLWRAPSLSNVSKSCEGEVIVERLTEEVEPARLLRGLSSDASPPWDVAESCQFCQLLLGTLDRLRAANFD